MEKYHLREKVNKVESGIFMCLNYDAKGDQKLRTGILRERRRDVNRVEGELVMCFQLCYNFIIILPSGIDSEMLIPCELQLCTCRSLNCLSGEKKISKYTCIITKIIVVIINVY